MALVQSSLFDIICVITNDYFDSYLTHFDRKWAKDLKEMCFGLQNCESEPDSIIMFIWQLFKCQTYIDKFLSFKSSTKLCFYLGWKTNFLEYSLFKIRKTTYKTKFKLMFLPIVKLRKNTASLCRHQILEQINQHLIWFL